MQFCAYANSPFAERNLLNDFLMNFSCLGTVLEDLVSVLLNVNPEKRPSAEQVLKVPALQTFIKTTFKKCVAHRQRKDSERAAGCQNSQV